MSIQELEDAVRSLPLEEARHLRRILDARLSQEIEGDGAPHSSDESVRAHAQAQDLIGSVDGPTDLSSNKAYLADLGRNSLS